MILDFDVHENKLSSISTDFLNSIKIDFPSNHETEMF